MEQDTQKEPVVVMTQNEKWMKDHPLGTFWLIGFSVLCIGCTLTVLIITAVIGIPLIILGLILLGIALIITILKPIISIIKKNKAS